MAAAESALALITKGYWILNQAYEGHGGEVTVGDALHMIGEARQHLNPQRPVSKALAKLESGIITGSQEQDKATHACEQSVPNR